MPVLQFYVFGSAQLGSETYTVATGSRARCPVPAPLEVEEAEFANENRAKKKGFDSQAGLLTWVHRVSEATKKWIMMQQYGNDSTTIQKLHSRSAADAEFVEKHFPKDIKRLEVAHFTPEAFLVRPASCIYIRL